jgi:hypothetical protein
LPDHATTVLREGELPPVTPWGLRPPTQCAPQRGSGFCPSFPLCYHLGLCGWDGERCVPRDGLDCRLSRACARFGWCGQVGDRCGAIDEADCERCWTEDSLQRSGLYCGSTGTPVMGRCVPQSGKDCWHDCKMYGHCTLQNGACVAVADSECEYSWRCEQLGACVVDPKTQHCAIPLAKP